MNAAICTLFEGHYHHGVAALVNSLYKQGFRGDIYAGYRGALPTWANSGIKDSFDEWKGSSSLYVEDGVFLHFLPLDTDYHFTNYKPDFILRLLDGIAKVAEAIYYLDPDILVTAPWFYFEEWVSCGVAVCEDVNSPLQAFHPKRVFWRKYYDRHNLNLSFKNAIYVNGGFVGVLREYIDFVFLWKECQELMSIEIGGLNRSAFINSDQLEHKISGDFAPFGKTDQDALNATIEAYNGKISFMGKEAMNFENGLSILPHALGQNKPWLMKPLIDWCRGTKPRNVDKEFWNNTRFPIKIYSSGKIYRMNFFLQVTSFLSRFYCKS